VGVDLGRLRRRRLILRAYGALILPFEKETRMPKYLLEVNYTLDGVRGVVAKGGSARKSAAQAAAKSLGGKLDTFHFAFGGTDVFTIADLPDNEAAAALALAVGAGGGATVRTVVLLSTDEIDAASQKAVKYSPPGS
jgi:uncharacterized protein with GYD domain